jgi:hypothetical protein
VRDPQELVILTNPNASGVSLKILVSAEGIESAPKCSSNNLQSSGWHKKQFVYV